MVVSEARHRRVFVAVPLPDDARLALQDHLAGVRIPGRVVPPQNWHLTLRFIGWADEVGYDRLLAALDESDLGGPFVIGLGAIGAFPRASKATVVWVDVVTGAERLADLAEAGSEAAELAGFGQEDRPYRPHLTLSRVRPPVDVTDLIDGFAPVGTRWRCDSVVVFESHLTRGGAVYEPLETFPLVG